ncbi:MAG: ABC transporter ATP-binding protein [Lactococcus chungangensis]|jgi:ABC-type multidrug transport system, ATPase and permease components|uniref:ABC transporter ATP-binding protein n=2 Tax=Pseudolactococcus chungangensis TaxID=451457 RepID=A0A1K2HC49_9LACT|nr:ABC transporter ATP-binding protein [Lactococcus chungangensis]MDD3016625.1 ABC transporter ATP-binding protein [Lactococcus chungangensis]NLH36318.1 ABC transporter ATP-binding protein [Lactococcus chungangensis]PCS04797.1 ABC transporter ATP-binding protein [Lactococcus chungangensis CAU 28 = DSM 22330]SFZ73874.1 ATP-binding cassette, subfamily B [Lactococcus chungangensis CAU 28 = DSM 22330]
MPTIKNTPKKSHSGGFGPGRGLASGGEKPKDVKKALGDLVRYVKPWYAAILVAAAAACGGAYLTIIGPDRLSEITNKIMEGLKASFIPKGMPGHGDIDLKAITSIGITLIAFYLGSAILSYAQGFIMATVTQRASKKLRQDISTKINKLPLRYFDSHPYGDTLSRVTNDVDAISQALNQSVGSLVSALTLFFGTIIMMFKTNVEMSLTAIATTAIGFGLMMLIMTKSQKFFNAQQNGLGEVNGFVEEVYTGHNIVKVSNADKAKQDEFDEINERLYNSVWKSQFLSGLMMPIMQFIGNFGYGAVCLVGAILAIDGKIEFGVIVAFMIYIRLFTQPLTQIAQAVTSMQSAGAASERIFTFFAEPELEDETGKATTLVNPKGAVEFKNVRFGYTDERVIINDFSAKAEPGQKIAIVGPTGAGKSTMVNLLMRFYDINSGQIIIDGTPIMAITREAVHDQFSMVLQDTWLFEGTVKENLIYNQTNITDEQVIAAAKAVGVDHFINTLPNGYDSVLKDAEELSVGERQLLTIARALLKDAPMLILDEATSSVDTRTEELIQKAMDKLMEGRTSFVIAHRLSTIKNADLILVMKDGDIIESGNHETLLEQGGFYADLYNSQFESVA